MSRIKVGWNDYKLVEKSKIYKNVELHKSKKSDHKIYKARYCKTTINGIINTSRFYETEKEAAKSVDLFKIKHGLEPINVLKRK